MITKLLPVIGFSCAFLAQGITTLSAASAKAETALSLSEAGQKMEIRYAGELKALREEIQRELPRIDEKQVTAFQSARNAVKKAEAEALASQDGLGRISTAKALVEHAKGKWIGGAEKGIAEAQAALKKATTEAEREAANKDLAKWQANKEDGLKALKERQEALEKARADEPQLTKTNEAAKAALAKARAAEQAASQVLLTAAGAVLTGGKLDARLVKGAVLAGATARGMAEFAQQGKEQAGLVEQLLADTSLMKLMLEAGGARAGKFGRAMELFTTIQKSSPKARDGSLRRLALAVALEHANPVGQSNPADQTGTPTTVDPVKRYLHYEHAFLAGELDPAFKDLTVWEMRMVVDCDAPDSILTWGREMLRNYRPDHISNPDYGWRYSGTVRTEVRYGSQNVKDDLPSLHSYQNIVRNGGVCGRRAFFGRFILQSFGIPTWGVTQHKHAAVSHWTPKGWVVNLGAGFEHSWWDKEDAPRSGADFLSETQAREHTEDFLKVLRAQWISRVLGEKEFNDRKGVPGDLWSSMAHYQTLSLASTAVSLGPLGQELAEANEPKEKLKGDPQKTAVADQKIVVGQNGTITIPAVACGKPSGPFAPMKAFPAGTQLHCAGGFKAEYAFDVPQAGEYALTARVVTVQEGHKMGVTTNEAKTAVEIGVPYTMGQWEQTKPVNITLAKGKNVLRAALQDGSRGLTIKEFTLSRVK